MAELADTGAEAQAKCSKVGRPCRATCLTSDIYYYAWLCPWVRSSVRACVRACVRVKNGSGSRIPDELSPVTRKFTVIGQSTTCLYVKCEKMLALSSDYKT